MLLENEYDYNINDKSLILYLNTTKNNIFKLLPLREENKDWEKYLTSILSLELKGCDFLFNSINFLPLITKLCSLYNTDYSTFRKGIFEALNILDNIIKDLEKEER